MMIAADQCGRLELVNQRIRALQLPIRVGLIPHAIEPDSRDVAIVRKQLRKLRVHEIEITLEIAAARTAGGMSRPTKRKIIRIVPIQL